MAKRLINKRLLNEYFNDEMAPSGKLFEQRDQHAHECIRISLNIYGMELDSTEEIGRVDVDYGQAPRYTLHSKTSVINAEAVRKLFGAQNYLEMIECIKERFHEETAYEDFQNYLHENKII